MARFAAPPWKAIGDAWTAPVPAGVAAPVAVADVVELLDGGL